jgi:predicted hydrocarbon binding protein
MKGTYQDNLRILYREYPQLSQNSDYFRINHIRPLSGAALEQSWRGYERNNGHEIPEPTRESTGQPLTAETMMPVVITYNIGGESVMARKETPKEPEPIEKLERQEQNGWMLEDGERIMSFRVTTFQSILDRVTAMAGEKVTEIILHQIGQEIGRTAFNYSRNQIQSDNLAEALDHVLSIRGWGRVLDLDKTDHGSSVTYVCTIKGCPLCYGRVSTSRTCGIMRGIVSGWLESFVQKKAESIETAYVGTGSQPCVFRVTFRK